MLKVGLTGGIGSGKSTVAECFARFGVPIVDTDVIARELTTPQSSALAEIRGCFGDGVLQADGALDRAALRERIFNDDDARRRLEGILHPRIRAVVERSLAVLDAPYALIVIPLLVETGGYRDLVDRVLVVDCDVEMQIARVMARSGLTRAEVSAILTAQATRQDRLAAADDVIANTGSREQLCEQAAVLHQRYKAFPRPSSP
jgi:dephospho-CoA kinase